ncbi:MAG: septum formation inhibitor Maf [Robiginitalea sp.]
MILPKPLLPYTFTILIFLLNACRTDIKQEASSTSNLSSPAQPEKKARKLTPEFKEYWYAGVAEVSSYELEQARYGEIREGEAVLIYVTEPFDLEKQVKANRKGPNTTSVLKLNLVRKFLTGIYPYSIMSSVFYPVSDNRHALKLTTSVQEWCGHVYAQLNNRESFEVRSHSYFESEADQTLDLPKTILEDELWTKLRFDPDALPTGRTKIVPSLEYLRLKHEPVKAYEATLTLSERGETRTYTLTYPELKRTLKIDFQGTFPYRVEGWTETYPSGFGPDSQMITSAARRKETLLTSYWRKNANSDVSLRDSLGLSLK